MIAEDNFHPDRPKRQTHDVADGRQPFLGRKTASCSEPIFRANSILAPKSCKTALRTKIGTNEAEMVTQREVLTFIAKRTAERCAVTAQELARRFWLSADLAGRHLSRLWRERLIETDLPRPRGFGFRLEPGEAILGLRFRLAPRGQKRLHWYARQDKDGLDGLFGLFR